MKTSRLLLFALFVFSGSFSSWAQKENPNEGKTLRRVNVGTEKAVEKDRPEKKELTTLQAQDKANVEEGEDFPKYIETGNPIEDDKRYNEAKLEWIKNNPEKYKKMNCNDESSEKLENSGYKQ